VNIYDAFRSLAKGFPGIRRAAWPDQANNVRDGTGPFLLNRADILAEDWYPELPEGVNTAEPGKDGLYLAYVSVGDRITQQAVIFDAGRPGGKWLDAKSRSAFHGRIIGWVGPFPETP